MVTEFIKAFKEQEIEQALIIQGIGMLVSFEIGYYDGKTHNTRTFTQPFELISLGGSLAMLNGERSLHLHASLAGDNNTVVGGHLVDGKIAAIAEITIYVLDNLKLERKSNPDSGLDELTIKIT